VPILRARQSIAPDEKSDGLNPRDPSRRADSSELVAADSLAERGKDGNRVAFVSN
jgi:hypothetical protein